MHPTYYVRIITLIGVCALVLPDTKAVSPPPDGGYPNGNTAEGEDALFSLSTGTDNTATGYQALYRNTTGIYNTATGYQALFSNTTGESNTAVGLSSLYYNTTGFGNVSVGSFAMVLNTTGFVNTAIGSDALSFNATGNNNTAAGFEAMRENGSGSNNVAVGSNALTSNITGSNNTATGSYALGANRGMHNTATGFGALLGDEDFYSTGSYNTATGDSALGRLTTGINNVANGYNALLGNRTGNNNTADGQGALVANTTGSNNTAVGQNALMSNTSGASNIALGSNAGVQLTTGSNNIDFGHAGVAGESGTIRIGTAGTQTATFIAGIRGVPVTAAIPIGVDPSGQLGVRGSSARFKEAIKPMDKASEAIFSLQPVTFRYKKALDPSALPQFGLVAEEVAKVNPDLVASDAEGKPFTVRYDEVNAMLLNEFLKEHRKGEQQDRKIEHLEATVTQLQTALKAQAAQIQKVNARLETRAGHPRVVTND